MVVTCKETVVIVALLSVVALFSAETVPPKADVYLIADYAPAAVYEGDQIFVNVRVQNTSAHEIKATLFLKEESHKDETGAAKETAATLKEATVPPQSSRAVQFSIRQDMAEFSLSLKEGQKELAALKARVLDDAQKWPKTVVRNGVLETESGERVIFRTQRRDKKIDRAFLPMKWLLGSDEKEKGKAAAPRIAQFIPPGYSAQPATVLGPYQLDGLPPIVHATRQILDTIKDEKICILVLPPEDIEAATDPRVLRIMLEVLLVRLKQAGVESVVVVPPFKFGANETLLKNVWKETNDVCAAHQAKWVDPAEFNAEEFWRLDPKSPGVYGARPNADGRARLDSVIKTLVPNQK